MPFWNRLLMALFYFTIALAFIITLYYHYSQHFLSTITIIIFVHLAYMVVKLSLGVRVLAIKTVFTNIMGLVLIVSEAIKITADILMLVSLYEGYFLSRLGISIYALGIVISLSQRAAFANKDKEEDEKARIRNAAKLEEFKKLDTLKSRFFTNVSHELRTPLTLILAPINSVLNSKELTDRNYSLLKKAEQNGKNLLTMVSSILDLSKLESGKMNIIEKPQNLFLFASRLVAAFESHAQRAGIEYTFEYDSYKDLQFLLDSEKVETIFNNLLSNAIKYTPPGGKINVLVKDETNVIRLVIKDTGRGIHPDDIDHVFDRFYQSKREDAPIEGGSGISLALCYEYVTVLRGKIWLESELNEGSAFYVELPRKEVMGAKVVEVVKERIETGVIETRSTAKSGKIVQAGEFGEKVERGQSLHATGYRPFTILVVEDNHSLREYLETILTARYDVLTASNGKEAWEMLNRQYAISSMQDKATTNPKPFDSAKTISRSDCRPPAANSSSPTL